MNILYSCLTLKLDLKKRDYTHQEYKYLGVIFDTRGTDVKEINLLATEFYI
jgi:hypothetical protein